MRTHTHTHTKSYVVLLQLRKRACVPVPTFVRADHSVRFDRRVFDSVVIFQQKRLLVLKEVVHVLTHRTGISTDFLCVCVCVYSTFTPATRTPSADLTTFLKKSSSFSFLFFPRTLSCYQSNHRSSVVPAGSCDLCHVTHILVVLQENMEVEVFPENWVGGYAAQKDLVHGDGLLEDGQVLSETEGGSGSGSGPGPGSITVGGGRNLRL